jgi:hypothetical protein
MLTSLTALLLILTAACGGESKQTQPVVTTTDSGSSSAPPAKEVQQRGKALVRFIHAVPGVAPLDLFAEGAKAFADARYKTLTPYREMPGDEQTFRLRLAGQDTAEAIAEESEGFGQGKHYTAIALPARGGLLGSKSDAPGAELRFVGDDLVAPASGRAKVRVINASRDLGEVDVYAAGRAEPLLKGVGFADAKYVEVEPTTGALEVRRAGENVATLGVQNVSLGAGKIYTIFVVGAIKGASKLESVVVEDEIGGATTDTNQNRER